MTSRTLTPLLDGLGFGEGLRWHDGRLWFSDFFEHRVSSIGLDGDVRVEAELDDRPSGLGWLPDGRLLIVSMDKRLVMRQEPDGMLEMHADLAAVAVSDANDMVVAADGTAYVGNFGGGSPRTAQMAIVRSDGTVIGGPDDIAFPNGSVITPDGGTLIVGESIGHRYRAFPIEADGTLGPGRVWAEVGNRSPDGCTLDAELAIWFANATGTEVVRVREGGEITDTITAPDGTYACALGGPDGRMLFIATARTLPTPDAPRGTGRLWFVKVDVAHAGLP
jgi:sugar lactone lactonase YvrE